MLHIHDVDLYPELNVNEKDIWKRLPSNGLSSVLLPSDRISFNLTGENFDSRQTIVVSIQYEDVPPVARNILLALGFVLGLALISLIIYKLTMM